MMDPLKIEQRCNVTLLDALLSIDFISEPIFHRSSL